MKKLTATRDELRERGSRQPPGPPLRGWVQQIAAANSHRAFSFALNMKFEHHHSRLNPQPVAVAEL
jgi:hypothetical protein